MTFLMISLTTLFTPTAEAAIFMGNPKARFTVDRPEGDFIDGTVYVYALRIKDCSGTETSYSVKQWVDPVAGYSVTIAGGDLCEATWEWDSDFEINGPGYVLGATPSYTVFNLDKKTIPPRLLRPWTIEEGSYTGHSPRVYMDMN